jgi:hypothetical protein
MPSTDRKLELKANIDGSDRLTAVGICQRVKEWSTTMPARNMQEFLSQTESLAKVNRSEGQHANNRKGTMPEAWTAFSGGAVQTDKKTHAAIKI